MSFRANLSIPSGVASLYREAVAVPLTSQPVREADMYIPASFQQTDRQALFDFIDQNSFGLLVSQVEGEPFASHLPFLLDRSSGQQGTLLGHLAVANPQWQHAESQNVLAVFSGPHAYISPSWYEAENVVPTWNYVALHVYGTLQVVQEEKALAKILEDFVTIYENSLPRPWAFDSTSDFARKMIKAVVGFRIEISRIEGKWKLNQNRPQEQRERVVRVLDTFTDDNSRGIADLMKTDLEGKR
jgi:transcriptional regulator